MSTAWTPLLVDSASGCTFGVMAKEWGVEAPDGRRVAFSQRQDAFLRFLKEPFSRTRSDIDAAIRSKGLSPELCPPFPIVEIIQAGLYCGSAYWQELAMNRLSELPDISAVSGDLRELTTGGLSQAVRQAARRLLRDRGSSPAKS